jgi:kinesin family protein 11
MANIQVVVRCRGRNERETSANSKVVVDLPSQNCTVDDAYVIVDNNHGMKSTNETKTYKIDQVYGSQADQRVIFERVAMPLFNDFMNGYNVTILSYGQTGTGKTYTMCGEIDNDDNSKSNNNDINNNNDNNDDDDKKHILTDKAGIIPRVLKQIFLSLTNQDDYVVKCSHIELYNEELKDLLADDDDKKLRLYESNGKNIIQNLKYDHITNFASGFDLLKRGLARRKTASTRINDVSSRSHAIFTILLYKESSQGKFLFSKMNLVDLAGSENISKSGAINQRAKEAGSINQSLLTLGRVINSLSLSTPASHIPYRESKLTRLLQDSLGGSTKTALITTISPAKINVEETISALDYACKAKNIKNLPQSGHESEIILKKTLVKNLSAEIASKNYDLIAARTKNGIYISEENYTKLTDENLCMRGELDEAKLLIELLLSKEEDFETFKHKNEIIREDLLKKIDVLDEKSKSTSTQFEAEKQKNIILLQKINTINSANRELTEKLDQISSECSDVKTKLEMKDRQIEDKNEEIFKLNTKVMESMSKINLLTKLINEHADQSYRTIKSIINKVLRQTEESSELVDSYSSTLMNSMKEFKLAVVENVETIKSNWYENSCNELKNTFTNFNLVYQKLGEFFEQTMISLEKDFAKSGLMKFQFTMDQRSTEQQKVILEQERQKFKDEALKAITSIINDYDQKVGLASIQSITHFGNELVHSENNKLRKAQQNSMEDISNMIKQAEKVNQIEKPDIKLTFEKLKTLNKSQSFSSIEPEIPEISTIRDRLNDDSVCESLNEFCEALISFKNHEDVIPQASTMEINGHTRIPTKAHSSRSPTRISPHRMSPMKAEIPKHIISAEQLANRKRRKVLQPANMN